MKQKAFVCLLLMVVSVASGAINILTNPGFEDAGATWDKALGWTEAANWIGYRSGPFAPAPYTI